MPVRCGGVMTVTSPERWRHGSVDDTRKRHSASWPLTLGLLRGDCVPSLVRRFEGRLKKSPRLIRDVEGIEQRLTARTSALGGLVGKERNLECIVGR